MLAYKESTTFDTGRLTWFDRSGSDLGFNGTDRAASLAQISPDGKQLAIVVNDPESGNRDIWLVNVATGSRLIPQTIGYRFGRRTALMSHLLRIATHGRASIAGRWPVVIAKNYC